MPDEQTSIRKQDDDGNNVFFNRIEQQSSGSSQVKEYIPFGVNDEDIQMYDDEGNKIGSLHDFYKAGVAFVSSAGFDFLAEAQFLKMGEVANSQNIKIWLDTSDPNSQSGE